MSRKGRCSGCSAIPAIPTRRISISHVMDGTSPLEANGLPYVFTSFEGDGLITEEAPLFTNGVVNIDKTALAGPHQNELPLNLEVVSFP